MDRDGHSSIDRDRNGGEEIDRGRRRYTEVVVAGE